MVFSLVTLLPAGPMYENTGVLINLGYCPRQPVRQRDLLPRPEAPGRGKSRPVPAHRGHVPAGTVALPGGPSGGDHASGGAEQTTCVPHARPLAPREPCSLGTGKWMETSITY